MGLFVRQDEQRSQLQEQIAAELQEKARKRALETEAPDGVSDSRYIEGTKATTSLAWIWVLIGIAAVGVILWLIVVST